MNIINHICLKFNLNRRHLPKFLRIDIIINNTAIKLQSRLMIMKTVAVIGGGASGMLAALTAAENSGNKVIIFERQQRVGRKLMATGNGRCNLSNTELSINNYHGSDPGFAAYALSCFPPEKTLEYFRRLGLLTVREAGGRVYPLSDSANSVVDMLRYACLSTGIETVTSCRVEAVSRRGDGFMISAGEHSCRADRVIVACGGMAGGKLGGVSDGYALLCSLGHSRTALMPALVQVTTDPEYPRALKGVRADAELKIISEGRVIAESRGELQFTEKGISGPVTFEVSRAAACLGERKAAAHIDFLADYPAESVMEMLREKAAGYGMLPCEELFTGLLHNRLGKMLVKYSGISGGKTLAGITEDELERAACAARDFRLRIKGTEGFDNAQVTAGGIKTSEFDPHTLESRIVPGLFACGEVLDIDGDCGGYNLQWAWASGRLAGRLGE